MRVCYSPVGSPFILNMAREKFVELRAVGAAIEYVDCCTPRTIAHFLSLTKEDIVPSPFICKQG